MTSSRDSALAEIRALVVFHGRGAGPFARFLAPGFRHCFVCVPDTQANAWIRFDGQAGCPRLQVDAPLDFDLAQFYRDAGYVVVEHISAEPRLPIVPVLIATCVGAAKRILGVRAPFVLTPHQLYRHLA